MKKLYGVTTAMTTPFYEDGSPDIEAIRELTDFLIEAGVNCLYPLGTTGEMFKMTMAQRMAVCEAIVSQANHRCTVYIHCGAMNPRDVIALAKHAYSTGADGVGVVTPVYFGINDSEMYNYYSMIAQALPPDFPIYLYSIPQCAKNDISVETAQRLAQDCPNIVGIKYSFADLMKTYEYMKISDGSFSVLQGADTLFVPVLAMGCDGVVSGISGVFPEPFVAAYKAFLSGDIAGAQKYQRLCNECASVLKNGASLAYFKQALRARGLKSGMMKTPSMELPQSEVEAFDKSVHQIANAF